MFRFKNYVRAESLEEAYELNQKRSNVVLGGMLWLKMENLNKQTAIDLSGLGLDKVEESEEEFRIGAMCTLRELEINPSLNQYFGSAFKESLKHIVGVQFRNSATIGGSVFGRYGFSDVLTLLMGLDSCVELYPNGRVSMEEFAGMPKDNQILTHIIIKKDNRKVHYSSERMTETDFPIITCAAAFHQDKWIVSLGARPGRAVLLQGSKEELIKQIAEEVVFGSNMRGSAGYRRHLAGVLFKRAVKSIEEKNVEGSGRE